MDTEVRRQMVIQGEKSMSMGTMGSDGTSITQGLHYRGTGHKFCRLHRACGW